MKRTIYEKESTKPLCEVWENQKQMVISLRQIKELLRIVKSYKPKEDNVCFIFNNSMEVRKAGEQHKYRVVTNNLKKNDILITRGIYKEVNN